MFRNLMNKYATTFTTTLFLVSAVSGVFLFFHLYGSTFKAMHEWLSMVLLVPFVFHVAKNWRPFTTYFKRSGIYVAIAASLVASIAFGVATSSSAGGGSPVGQLFSAIERSTVTEVAPLFDKSPEDLAGYLRDNGYTVAAHEDTLQAIAQNSGRSGREIVSLVARVK